ncbi:hypothetical protein TNCV_3773371 [Trichonephila clavipes]|nr:hypothetical protein TNCV_3773371 [Trichonephila clavipes]
MEVISNNPFVATLTVMENTYGYAYNRMMKLPVDSTEPWITFTQSSLLSVITLDQSDFLTSRPPRLPYLSVSDYFLWGTLKPKMYHNNLQELL